MNNILLDNVTTKMENDGRKKNYNIILDTLNHTIVLVLSTLSLVILAGGLLSVYLSQKLHKRHRGYNPTDTQVSFFFYLIMKFEVKK